MDKIEFLKEILAKGKKLEETADESEILETDEECKIMLQLSEKIIDVIIDNDLIKDDMKGWASIILLALGRATAIVLKGLDHVLATDFMFAEIMYTKIVLPTSLGIIQLQVEEDGEEGS